MARDELRHTMAQYGMGDEATIDEIIKDVDTDKVLNLSSSLNSDFSIPISPN